MTEGNGYYLCPFCKTKYVRKTSTITQNIVYNVNHAGCGGVRTDPSRLVISDTVTSIAKNAYRNNMLLEEVVFSSNTTMIGESAFEGCVNLRSIKNYGSVKYFGDYAFKGAGLKEISIGKNVETIGREAFSCMPYLEKVVYMPNKNIRLKDTFIKCPVLKEVEMDQHYFFPSLASFLQVRNNPGNTRPTIKDAFWNTPYYQIKNEELFSCRKNGDCPDCGGKLKRGLFHIKCKNCGIDLMNE